MTLIRLIQRASILAGMTLAGLSVHSNPVRAEDALACVIANNGKTVCGTLKVVERACITTATGNTVCGKFKSAKKEGQEEARTPAPNSIYQKELDGIAYTLKSCRREESIVKCNFVITTKKDGKQFYIVTGAGHSSMVDANGRTYPSSSNLEYNGGSKFMSVRIDMSVGVDYVVDINFEKTPGQITKATLINLSANEKLVQFRNVPISN
jgi:hypothetical protein